MINNQKILSLFLLIISILIIIGFIFIYSSSSVYALEKFGIAHYYIKKQSIGLILGLIALAIARSIPLPYIKKYSPFLFIGSLALTALTLIPQCATITNGSSRWLTMRGLNFQPSELLKIAYLIYLAAFLEKKSYRITSFKQGYLPFLCIIALPAIILLKQPDFGQTITITITGFLLFFIAQGSIYHLLVSAIPALSLAALLIFYKPYRLRRILIFLNPWQDPQGAGFQIIQSLIAIGSGKLWGVGITQSKQKFFYLPMQHTDFIFSIIAEETGFFGVALLISIYIGLLLCGAYLAFKQKNLFTQLLIMGFTILTSLQAIINIYVATGLAPTKGIGLPFISYGNSSLLCNLVMVGIIINCATNKEKKN